MVKIVLDEDMPRSIKQVLTILGYEVKDIRDHGLRGADDNKIFQFAQDNGAVLMTGDQGFGNPLQFPLESHNGIVIVHFPTEIPTEKINLEVGRKLNGLKEEDFRGSLIVIEPGKVRVKRASHS